MNDLNDAYKWPKLLYIDVNTDVEHKKFKEDLALPFILLSDPDRNIAESYGVPVHLGRFPSKSSFVIGPDNKIHFVYDWLFRLCQHVAWRLRASLLVAIARSADRRSAPIARRNWGGADACR